MVRDFRTAVRCRPWTVGILSGLIGVCSVGLLLSPPSPQGGPHAHEADVRFAAVLLLLAVCGAIWFLANAVVADEEGISWRTLRGRRHARWDEIEDYYVEMPRAKPITVVKTTRGRLRCFEDLWSGLPALREFVQQHAASAGGPEWGVYGTRPCDPMPRVFQYERVGNSYAAVAFFGIYAVALLWLGGSLVRAVLASSHYGSMARIGLAALISLVFLAMLAMIWTMSALSVGDSLRRRSERVIVERSGITFERDGHRSVVPWGEVVDYYVEGASVSVDMAQRHVVETTLGRYDFTRNIGRIGELKAAVARYAANAAARTWSIRRDTDALGDVRSRWTGGREGVGARVYHYRTRTNRALLSMLWVVAGMPSLCQYIYHRLTTDDPAATPGTLLASLLMASTALRASWRYHAAAVLTDEEGITQIGVGGERRIAWSDVEGFRPIAGGLLAEVRGPGGAVRFWSHIADMDPLKDAIAEKAVNCRQQGWESTRARTRSAE